MKLEFPMEDCTALNLEWRLVYNRLTPPEQAIVHILAVYYSPSARTNILNALKILFPKDPMIKAWKTADFDPMLQELVDLKVLLQEGARFQCSRIVAEPVCRLLAEHDRLEETVDALDRAVQGKSVGKRSQFMYEEDFYREIRIGLYRRDVDYVRALVSETDAFYPGDILGEIILAEILAPDFDARWTTTFLPRDLQADIAWAFKSYFKNLNKKIPMDILTFLDDQSAVFEDEQREEIRAVLAEESILSGRIEAAQQMVAEYDGLAACAVRGWCAFLRGENADALAHFENAMTRLKKKTRKRKLHLNTTAGLFYILALLKTDEPDQTRQAKTLIAAGLADANNPLIQAYDMLEWLIAFREGDPEAAGAIKNALAYMNPSNPLSKLIQLAVVYWVNRGGGRHLPHRLKQLHDDAKTAGRTWIAAETAALLSKVEKGNKKYHAYAAAFFEDAGIESIIELTTPESKWKQALRALMILREESPADEKTRESRMVWILDVDNVYGGWDLTPLVQVRSRGSWTKGRKVALKRLYCERAAFDFLTGQDEKVCAGIEEERTFWHGYPDVSYDFSAASLKALVGHPLVFSAASRERMEVEAGTPELMVEGTGKGGFEISFSHDLDTDSGVQLIIESPTRVKVIETGKELQRIAKIIGNGLKVPAVGKKELIRAVEKISPLVTVHSQIDGLGESATEVSADATPVVHLRPHGAGLRLTLLIQPFAPEGPCFRPGEGGETLIADIGGSPHRTRRDFAKEVALSEGVVSGCPTLLGAEESPEVPWEWCIPDLETGLEILMELGALGERVVLKWPEGETFKIPRQVDFNRFFVNVEREKDWFAVSGRLMLEEDAVLSMDRLLSLLENTRGRFVRLEDGQFLALANAFRRYLDELAAFSKKSGKKRLFHPLAALALEETAGRFGGFKGDAHWRTHLKRLGEARALTPETPSTLKAELREYQTDGFTWLARLAHWGVGACLADDMGLGKTVQALAVILTTAAGGPSLVVAPTSVCMNWEAEARRFAPSLTVKTLSGSDRDKTVSDLSAFDLLVVSYGLLQQEKTARLLAGVRFANIVLDEAQAIKNLFTKRSKAAMNLQGDFRLITTGTPIENHLGELWNLFQFITPGLLGSLTSFNETFAVPIEKHQDRRARKRLKKLVQPYILRRTKDQVLEDLPPRTDILLRVKLNPDEMALYEALRQKAMAALSEDSDGAGGMHLRILAEITKLRRACCNSKLVLPPEAAIPSAKLTAFDDIVEELLSGGHKALVFSQFTSHLEIIREHLNRKKIRYQYLDGATPQKTRTQRVGAFQDGDGDLFLISLKAGGVGLNLTAADYVIHMDPWWNPAVEDQASDRAHRIGQERPVTVYRLIAENTIEEKIVDLHKAKRDLADNLLEGADMSGKMSTDELLQLIRNI